jgi:hypothetical protein
MIRPAGMRWLPETRSDSSGYEAGAAVRQPMTASKEIAPLTPLSCHSLVSSET